MSVQRESNESVVEANGIKICYDEFGDPASTPLLLVMGLAAQMIVWEVDFCNDLAARGFRVIRFDNRDIGKSTHFSDAPAPAMNEIFMAAMTKRPLPIAYTLRDMAADAMGLLDALGIATAHVVGLSMGGAIAQEIAINFPARVRSLTSIMASSGNPNLPPPSAAGLGVLTRPRPATREAYVADYVANWQVLNGPNFAFDEARTRAQAELGYERGLNPDGVSRQMLAIVASGDRRDALHRVALPALVIHGSADPLVPVEAGRDTAASIPGAELVIVEGMGHTLPRAAWPRVIDAIARHASAALPNS